MPNSENSCGKTCGSEVHIQCVVCSRCVVSAVPNSPDCTTKASRPAARHKRKTGSRSQRPRREVIAWMVIQSGAGTRAAGTDCERPVVPQFRTAAKRASTFARPDGQGRLSPHRLDCSGKIYVDVYFLRQ